jgi:hypothetical protein
VVNDELELAAPIDVIRDRVTDLTWAIDLAAGRVDRLRCCCTAIKPVFHLPGIAGQPRIGWLPE